MSVVETGSLGGGRTRSSSVEKRSAPGKVDADIKAQLGGKLQRRMEREVLALRSIIREEAADMKSRTNNLEALIKKRRSKNAMLDLNIIKEDDDAKSLEPVAESESDSLNTRKQDLAKALGARMTPTGLRQRGILHDPEEEAVKKKAISDAKSKLEEFFVRRSDPEKLLEHKVVSDIGFIPDAHVRTEQGNQLQPKQVELKEKVVSVSCGWAHSLALTDTGLVYSFGSGENGRLGVGRDHPERSSKPLLIETLKEAGKVTCISAGDNHSAAIVDGNLYTWGVGSWGRLGHGVAQADKHVPTLVQLEQKATSVSCGGYHTAVLTERGEVHMFGWNKNGRLGQGDIDTQFFQGNPSHVPGLGGVTEISAGQNHTLALTQDGKVLSWGNGVLGQLGHGDEKERTVPTQVQALEGHNIVRIRAGGSHSLAISDKGVLFAWGYNKTGQTGQGIVADTSCATPAVVKLDAPADQIAAAALECGKAQSFVLVGEKTFCWGNGSRGVLGTEKEDVCPNPVETLASLKGPFICISSAFAHTLVITGDGTLYAFGGKENGKLGFQ